MFIPREWTVIAKRVSSGQFGVITWRPCNQYSDEDISKLYDMAMKDVCFLVQKRTANGFDLLLKLNVTKADANSKKEEHRMKINQNSSLINKIYER